ncbi:MAG: RHS repeat domain-containing protein [Fimbriimonadales bacterium]
MPTVRYTVVNGEVIAEKRGGVRRTYVPDPLGSTVALLDNSQTKTDTFTYWPYGEVKTRTGTTQTPFQFVGARGYYADSATRTYVRARHLATALGCWLTVDALWPRQRAYAYAGGRPITVIDPSGSLIVIISRSCQRPPWNTHGIAFKVRQLCRALANDPNCGCKCGDWPHLLECLLKKCNSVIKINCLTAQECLEQYGSVPCAFSQTPGGTVNLCPPSLNSSECDCLQNTILHEMAHGCGEGEESVPDCVADFCTWNLPECEDLRRNYDADALSEMLLVR